MWAFTEPRKVKALAFGLAVSVGGTAFATAKPVVAVVVNVKGEPWLDGKPLKKNAFVYLGSVIETRAGGCVAAALVTGAEVRLNERTEARLDGGGGREGTSVTLVSGQVWIRHLQGKAGLQVRAPQAVVAASGAEADVAVGSRTAVRVYEGSVDVTNDRGKQPVAANQRTEVGGTDQAPQAPTALLPKDFETWHTGCAGQDLQTAPAPGRAASPTLQIRRKPLKTAPSERK
ncbi:MAG: hypothetical protein FD126_899 [Elusimicrobia bacterium]|nr:MAG: hypothetical protein FD126_899 [Elusimicrobiota bacterium]